MEDNDSELFKEKHICDKTIYNAEGLTLHV